MNDQSKAAWVAPEADLPTGRDLASFERQLALVDRIIGLEAELAETATKHTLGPSEQLRVEQELARLRSSTTWRAGRLVSAPIRLAHLAVRRNRGTGG